LASPLLVLLVVLAILLVTVAGVAAIEERLAPCLACHGENGQSSLPEVPSLGGQPAFYLSVQLYMFREKMRNIEPMPAMMKGLSDDDLGRMAQAISRLSPPSATSEPTDLSGSSGPRR
jgi:cytochrome c553